MNPALQYPALWMRRRLFKHCSDKLINHDEALVQGGKSAGLFRRSSTEILRYYKMSSFKNQEKAHKGEIRPLQDVLASLAYNGEGLIPAIAQQYDSGEVLMMAWMNRASIDETLQTNRVCYWSRSRQAYWRKGESSGQVQQLKSMAFDCDGDTILLKVDQTGPACHTGRQSCFFHSVKGGHVVIASDPMIDPETLYND